MTMTAYAQITGTQSGKIEGDCQVQGHQNQIEVYGLQNDVEVEVDPYTKVPKGYRRHGPLVLTCKVGKQTPLLFKCLCTGEQLSNVTLQCYAIDKQGNENNYHTITLKNAIVTKRHRYTYNSLDPKNGPYGDMEDYYLHYAEMTETSNAGNTEHTDNIEKPQS